VTLPGDGLFNFEDAGGMRAVPEVDTDLFALLEDLATEIEEGDDSQIEQGMADLQKLYEHVVEQRGVLGARTVRLEQAQTAAGDAEVHAREILADVEAVDIVQAIMEMQSLEVSYQAALAATSKLAQMPTLFELAW
jgi:flagellar hook-associated protein 3 FlgL